MFLGLVIYSRRTCRLALAKHIWLLALFAIFHGLHDWLAVFSVAGPVRTGWLEAVRLFLLPVSFYFLLQFGINGIFSAKGKRPKNFNLIPVLLIAAWAAVVVLSGQKYLTSETIARFLMGIPGAALTIIALLLYLPEVKTTGMGRAALYLKLAVSGFFFYGIVAALAPTGPFFPDSVLNDFSPEKITMLPALILCALSVALIAFSLVKMLSIFEWEAREELEKNILAHNARLEIANIRTSQALQEKEVLLRELYHRTKNNMQVISSLIGLRASSLEDDGIKTMCNDMRDKIRAMALVHEQLYETQDLSNLDIKNYIERLAGAMMPIYMDKGNKVALSLDIDSVSMNIDTVMPCGLILSELISNSFKYAFPDGREGEIKVSLRRMNENRIEFIYSDNGMGFSKPANIKQSQTLGLRLVDRLVTGQMGGNLEIAAGNGTEFRINFKIP